MNDFAKQVALAITRSSGTAGQAYDAEEPQGAEQRAENLTSPVGEYGPYIVEGDPYEWSEGALATILMEQKGSKGDCIVPLNYYGDGMTVSHLASSRIKGGYIEFVNAAVAVVHKLEGEGTIKGTLFTPGQVVSTPGAIQALERNEASSFGLLARHLSGDWGSLDSEDADTQRLSLQPENQDEQIMSVYDLDDGAKVWIITEWNRSVTTLLLPEEY